MIATPTTHQQHLLSISQSLGEGEIKKQHQLFCLTNYKEHLNKKEEKNNKNRKSITIIKSMQLHV